MHLRGFLTGTRAGRTFSILVLAVFVLLCGLHIAGGHHDSHSDSIGVASDALVLLGLVGFALVLATIRPARRCSIAPFLTLASGVPPPAVMPPDFVHTEAPLLC